MDELRDRRGNEFQKQQKDLIRAELGAGLSGVDEILNRIQEEQTLKAITLSITTRGIGFGICDLLYLSNSYQETIQIPDVYSIYRTFLAVTEAKLQHQRTLYPLPIQHLSDVNPLSIDPQLQLVARTLTVTPTPFRRLINAIGIIKYDEKIYLPSVAKDVMDNDKRLVPLPESIVISNLRKVVVALADPQTPRVYRQNFRQHSPLPAATWDAEDILLNPDDFISANYSYSDDLPHDMRVIAPFLAKLQKVAPKMVDGAVDFEAPGSPSLFISNEQETLRAPERPEGESLQQYYAKCIPKGNIREYFSMYKLNASDRILGQVNLLGEQPIFENFMTRLYTARREEINPFNIMSNYIAVTQILYAL